MVEKEKDLAEVKAAEAVEKVAKEAAVDSPLARPAALHSPPPHPYAQIAS